MLRLALVLVLAAWTTLVHGQARPTLDVLFIGNSYTYVNNLPHILKGLAEGLREGPAIEPAMAVNGGMPLGWHLANGPAMRMLEQQAWDVVILQEHSLLGGYVIDGEPRLAPPGLFHSNARVLVPKVRAVNAQPLFFMTWARRGRPQEEPILTSAYLDIGRELNVPVSPVGLVWEDVRRRHPDIDLFSDDGAHPSPAGSYLAASVLYISLTGRSPEGAPARIDGNPWSRRTGEVDTTQTVTLVDLPRDQAARLQDAAWTVTSAASATPTAAGAR